MSIFEQKSAFLFTNGMFWLFQVKVKFGFPTKKFLNHLPRDSLFCAVDSKLNITYKKCLEWDSNCQLLVSDETALPTVPQSLRSLLT